MKRRMFSIVAVKCRRIFFFLALLIIISMIPGVFSGTPVGVAEADAAEFLCTPANVAVYETRVHVKCTSAAPGGILYFAYPTDDIAKSSQVLSVLSTALAAGRQLSILYNASDTSGSAFGCQTNDCRTITGAVFWQ